MLKEARGVRKHEAITLFGGLICFEIVYIRGRACAKEC